MIENMKDYIRVNLDWRRVIPCLIICRLEGVIYYRNVTYHSSVEVAI